MNKIKEFVKNKRKKNYIAVFSDTSKCANKYYQSAGFKLWEDWETDKKMDKKWMKELDVPIIVHKCESACVKVCMRQGKGRHLCNSRCRSTCPNKGKILDMKAPFYIFVMK